MTSRSGDSGTVWRSRPRTSAAKCVGTGQPPRIFEKEESWMRALAPALCNSS